MGFALIRHLQLNTGSSCGNIVPGIMYCIPFSIKSGLSGLLSIQQQRYYPQTTTQLYWYKYLRNVNFLFVHFHTMGTHIKILRS